MGNKTGKVNDLENSSIPPGTDEKEFFKNYIIEKNKIGTGAFSEIKICKRISDNKKFAIKLVTKKGLTLDDINALKKEVIVLKKCNNNNNLIKLIDYCDTKKKFYMILELCNGDNIYDILIKKKNLNEKLTKYIIKNIVNGLNYLHKNNFVHRDLKPDNLMFANKNDDLLNNTVKIIDFGLAGEFKENVCKTPCGTAEYAAPEVLDGEQHDSQADLWSLGAIMYTLLSGFPPFFDEKGNLKNIKYLIKQGKYSFSSKIWNDISPEAKDLIDKLLVKDTKQRLSCDGVLQHCWILDKKLDTLKNEESKSQEISKTLSFIPPPPSENSKHFASKSQTLPRMNVSKLGVNPNVNYFASRSSAMIQPYNQSSSGIIPNWGNSKSLHVPPPPSSKPNNNNNNDNDMKLDINIPGPPLTNSISNISTNNGIPGPPITSNNSNNNIPGPPNDDKKLSINIDKNIPGPPQPSINENKSNNNDIPGPPINEKKIDNNDISNQQIPGPPISNDNTPESPKMKNEHSGKDSAFIKTLTDEISDDHQSQNLINNVLKND